MIYQLIAASAAVTAVCDAVTALGKFYVSTCRAFRPRRRR